MTEAILETKLPGLELHARGKVRDIYKVPAAKGAPPRLLFVATDRISAFDVVLPTGIPQKGAVLTQISAFWFEQLASVVPNHLVTLRPSEMPATVKDLVRGLGGRAMLVERAQVVPIECVVRAYLASSVEKQYKETGAIQGIALPPGIPLGGRFPEPIFTPTTKEAAGHDVPLTPAELEAKVGKEMATKLKDLSLKVFKSAASHCEKRGLILCDTKFEFGKIVNARDGGEGALALVDEVLTPDSSRFFKASEHKPGTTPIAWDKQIVRDYLNGLKGWDKKPPGPPLPPEIVAETARRYREIFELVTGKSLDDTIKERQKA
jgi:phosphoribosylaminoimidazole-succinocarboxamide synthase